MVNRSTMPTAGWAPSLWRDTFVELLDDELAHGDDWFLNFNYTLTDKISQEEKKRGLKVFQSHTHGKFQCQRCRRFWSSAHVSVLFHYRLRKKRGIVVMRPFGQACLDCKGRFTLPFFSKEDVEKVLLKLFSKIRKNCYGEHDEDDEPPPSERVVFTKPHVSELCEACQQGTCSQRDDP
ncbi:receptor-transporting protein 3 isoform X1 [Nothobranchius furzeri]|uniref:Receptor (Chemosensory) transporter protein 2 n=4 Tax=Nothobranchius TaxID=28779 RepID=A0A1A8VCL8_NOTFU|nr:receptor-transporting protein 3 isoform X1 [Nothobranchius furzeri]KAF7211589.1 transcript variant X1 [Nothobranchius furzeri]